MPDDAPRTPPRWVAIRFGAAPALGVGELLVPLPAADLADLAGSCSFCHRDAHDRDRVFVAAVGRATRICGTCLRLVTRIATGRGVGPLGEAPDPPRETRILANDAERFVFLASLGLFPESPAGGALLTCSFCDAGQRHATLVAGRGVYICYGCAWQAADWRDVVRLARP